VPIIAVTGYGRESDRDHSAAAGIDHHLVKPASLEELERLLCKVPEAS
jgi:CheY-like chemotaxis protein